MGYFTVLATCHVPRARGHVPKRKQKPGQVSPEVALKSITRQPRHRDIETAALMKRQVITVDSEPEDEIWEEIEREVNPPPKKKTSTQKKKNQKKKKGVGASPKGRYWVFTQYDVDWQPPVPYPEGKNNFNLIFTNFGRNYQRQGTD